MATYNTTNHLLDQLPMGCCVIDGRGIVRHWNRQLVLWTGLTRERVEGGNLYELFPHLNVSRISRRIMATAREGTPAHFSPRLLPQFFPTVLEDDRGRVQQTTVIRTSVDEDGVAELMINVADVTEQAERADAYRSLRTRAKEAEIEVAKRVHENEMRQFAVDSHSIVSIADISGVITYANDRFCHVSGYDQEELMGSSHSILKSGHHSPEFFQEMWHTIIRGGVWQGEVKNRAKNGSHYWVDATIVPFTDSAGTVTHYVGIRSDITALKEAQRAASQSESMLKQVLDAIPVRVFWKDTEGRYMGCNGRFAEDAELVHPDDVVGKSDVDMIWSAHAERYRISDMKVMEDGVPELDVEVESASSRFPNRWVQSSKVPLTDPVGNLIGMFGCYADISERKRDQLERESMIAELRELKKRLEVEVATDPLTNLLNRRGMNSELVRAEAGFHRWRQPFSVVLCDLDFFKRVNDTLGHDAGDYLIRGVADRLKDVSRATDIVARWGGEEYLLLLPKTDREGLTVMMERLRAAVADENWSYKGEPIKATLSLGGCTFDAEGAKLETIIEVSDQALYEAKRQGRNRAVSHAWDEVLKVDKQGSQV
jgi:diguanylate cyclase (GGDEF)-like protein/PAS domain S-box-containing protein